MNLSQLFISVLVAVLLILSTEYIKGIDVHDHRRHYVPMNNVKGTTITVCIVEGDTVAQVAFPHTNMKTHIEYDTASK